AAPLGQGLRALDVPLRQVELGRARAQLARRIQLRQLAAPRDELPPGRLVVFRQGRVLGPLAPRAHQLGGGVRRLLQCGRVEAPVGRWGETARIRRASSPPIPITTATSSQIHGTPPPPPLLELFVASPGSLPLATWSVNSFIVSTTDGCFAASALFAASW